MKIIITLEVDQMPVPGNLNHLAAIISNPNTKNVTVEVKK